MTHNARGVWIAFLTINILLLNSCGGDEPKSAEEKIMRPVKTTVISIGSVFVGREFTGVVDALQSADLGFQVNGKLQQLDVKEGEQVSEGQLIAQLDQTDFKLQVESTQAEFERAEADFMRAEQLVKNGNISKSDYDSLKAKYSAANTQFKAARQNLEYTSLRAPFSGLIAVRHVDNFEIVQAKQTIVTLQDLSTLAIRIDVPESIMIGIDKNNNNRRIYARFDAFRETHYPLTLKEVSTRADPQTQTFRVTLTMPAPEDHNILPGMTATVIGGPEDQGNRSIFLSPQAVMEDADGRFVYIAEPKVRDEAVIARRTVATGRLLDQGLEVLSGLQEGDHVVTGGMSRIQEGMRVRLMTH